MNAVMKVLPAFALLLLPALSLANRIDTHPGTVAGPPAHTWAESAQSPGLQAELPASLHPNLQRAPMQLSRAGHAAPHHRSGT